MFFRKIKIFIKKFNFPLDISCNLWYIILALWFAGVAQLVEQLICNQQVGGSSPSTSSIYKELVTKVKLNMGVFPSGQRGQTVNLLSSTSVVRIHPLPPKKNELLFTKNSFFFYPSRRLGISSPYEVRCISSRSASRPCISSRVACIKCFRNDDIQG